MMAQNSDKTGACKMPRKMPEGRRFKKGQSGNPGGRPKAYAEVVELARELTPQALKALEKIMASSNEHAAIKAAELVLERAWGKVPDKIEMKTVEDLSDDELLTHIPGALAYAKKRAEEIGTTLEAILEDSSVH